MKSAKTTKDSHWRQAIWLAGWIAWTFTTAANAQEMQSLPNGEPESSAELRLSTLEDQLASLQLRLDEAAQTVPVVNQASCPIGPPACDSISETTHHVVYDGGFVLRPLQPSKTPFELKFEFHNQFRYTGFESKYESTTGVTGLTFQTPDRNDFNINRGRLVFSGYAFDPSLQYYVNIDYSTVATDSIEPLLAWISFDHGEAMKLYLGLGKVPGTWEWQQTSRYTLGIDRSLATTFFRPSISAGVWASGEPLENLHYTAFVGDGFNTLTLRPSELDTQLVYSGMTWWEPLGKFGVGFSDIETHQTPVVRIGHALTTTRNESSVDSNPGVEATVIRLSDGTRLIDPNALVAGTRVSEFDLWLYSVHMGIKHRGFSLSGEYYVRHLRNIQLNSNQPNSGNRHGSIVDVGFFAQAGAFVVPKKLEAFTRGSLVNGDFGSGDEFSVGCNWYLFGSRSARATAEVTSINDSPAQQSRTGYGAGASGTLLRLQLWTMF
ncbi:porin [Rhodopirellula sp. MGV]|uniref:porin n=1 Tax=Rhodopirellula sp. MGV TaxID=2023130 RepID=UPI000B96C978|nr:porin [Rhodopirellula sp. MGV]OYP36124.1 porin [Rhodopirellula sp. MGV]PNY36513.1 porin [Rhodopirellula baltica]PNY38244.1 porin [Rhodopirellula baltica]